VRDKIHDQAGFTEKISLFECKAFFRDAKRNPSVAPKLLG
jgi:hypothetical protein